MEQLAMTTPGAYDNGREGSRSNYGGAEQESALDEVNSFFRTYGIII